MSDVLILMGSAKDWDVMRTTAEELDRLHVPWSAHVTSAHRTPERTVNLVRDAEAAGTRVFICGAGMAAHLAGAVAAHTVRPVIGVPLGGGVAGGLDALLSTVQMPGGIPVATVAIGAAGARNAALLALEILALGNDGLTAELRRLREEQAANVEQADAGIASGAWGR
jgi:5-(carboxyamino)imidazole ribonucleotide mutase